MPSIARTSTQINPGKFLAWSPYVRVAREGVSLTPCCKSLHSPARRSARLALLEELRSTRSEISPLVVLAPAIVLVCWVKNCTYVILVIVLCAIIAGKSVIRSTGQMTPAI